MKSLLKQPFGEKVADLKWRVLHSVVAVNAVVSVISPSVTDTCPFCTKRE